eukprot:scaffold148_cov78-Phaeocystis_antarctica.AAC.15
MCLAPGTAMHVSSISEYHGCSRSGICGSSTGWKKKMSVRSLSTRLCHRPEEGRASARSTSAMACAHCHICISMLTSSEHSGFAPSMVRECSPECSHTPNTGRRSTLNARRGRGGPTQAFRPCSSNGSSAPRHVHVTWWS